MARNPGKGGRDALLQATHALSEGSQSAFIFYPREKTKKNPRSSQHRDTHYFYSLKMGSSWDDDDEFAKKVNARFQSFRKGEATASGE